MDLLSQGLLGSSLAITVAKPDEIRKAGLIGLLAGLSADLDFFIQSANDPLLNLEFHRHFTHSLFFIPIAALLLSLLFWPFFRRHLSWPKIFLFSLCGYLLSGLLDACTSYGTRLLWPLSEERYSLNIISIIDPIFTLSLLLGFIFSLVLKKTQFAQFFLVLCGLYLAFGWHQKSQIETVAHDAALNKAHVVEELLVKPTLGNLWLWRTVYRSGDTYHVNAIRRNPFTGETRVFTGGEIQRFQPNQHNLGIEKSSTLQQDINRFATFSNGYLALNPDNPNMIIDVRYSNLPDTLTPLWAITFNPLQPDQHARFEVYRDPGHATRQRFISMLLNQ